MSTARERDVTAETSPNAARPTDEIVDVLIIGAGASGAAVAWSLAETRMKILCLEQGDWIKLTEFPSNGRDWEARRYADFDISPNRRARDTDYPVNDENSLMKIANFNGVGGGTILFTAHYPRMHPSDTLRLRLIKIAARVVELKKQIKIHLPSSTPDQAIFGIILNRLPRLVT
jgi:hypothetical protein